MTHKPPVTGPEKDDICPNFHKPLHKCCPTCHFYQNIQGISAVKRYEGDPGEFLNFWGCAIAAQWLGMSSVGKAADAQTTEMNVLRNKMIDINEAQNATMKQLGKAVDEMMRANAEQNQNQIMLGAQIARTVGMLAQQLEKANKDRAVAMEAERRLLEVTNH